MSNFTYLFGAGASANAMPVIANFTERLKKFAKFLSEYVISPDEFPANNYPQENKRGIKPNLRKNQFIERINWLVTECDKHASIDTFARKLFLSKDYKNLYTLKFIVSEFFLFEQYFNGIDSRYDTFFATILKHDDQGELVLPPNVNILTWNYDKQLEYSFAQFLDAKDHNSIENYLNIYPRENMSNEIDRTCFSVIKLNGTYGGKMTDLRGYMPIRMDYGMIKDKIDGKTKSIIILNILQHFIELDENIITNNIEALNNTVPTILYSWENTALTGILRNNLYKAIESHHFLIIIGYSFPTFNRDMDRTILSKMTGLKKIYLQSKKKSIEGVKQRLESLLADKKIEIVPISDTKEFYIPFEF